MNYQPKLADLAGAFGFLCDEYGYALAEACDCKFMGTMRLEYSHGSLPNVSVEMERYRLEVLVLHDGERIGLLGLLKFLYPAKIFRSWAFYRRKRNFKRFFTNDCRDNFRLLFDRLPEADIARLHAFYQAYPYDVWKWIDK